MILGYLFITNATLIIDKGRHDIQQNNKLNTTLSILVERCYAQCRFDECRGA
jgi:hypothetical protein